MADERLGYLAISDYRVVGDLLEANEAFLLKSSGNHLGFENFENIIFADYDIHEPGNHMYARHIFINF